jgi:hypothetical protein
VAAGHGTPPVHPTNFNAADNHDLVLRCNTIENPETVGLSFSTWLYGCAEPAVVGASEARRKRSLRTGAEPPLGLRSRSRS